MTNHINLKSMLVKTIFMIGVFIFALACAEKKSTDSEEIAKQENIASLEKNDKTIVVVENDKDAMFLMEAAAMHLEEISLGKLAQQKGNSSHVRDLGKMMEVDHTKTLAELITLAKSKSIAIPTSITEDSKEVFRELNEENGNDFGKAYSALMVENHEDAIELYINTAKESADPDISTWTASKVPGLKTHLQHAEACKKECDKM